MNSIDSILKFLKSSTEEKQNLTTIILRDRQNLDFINIDDDKILRTWVCFLVILIKDFIQS
jgi:hypothetical protein